MTAPSELETVTPLDIPQDAALAHEVSQTSSEPETDEDNIIDDVEMSLFDHLEELRQRIF